MGTQFCGLTIMDNGFQIITTVNKYFGGILNMWIALPTKIMKLNVQQIKMFSPLMVVLVGVNITSICYYPHF